MVDILAVGPGLPGQSFDDSVLSKIQYLYQNFPNLVHIAVDGGINDSTSKLAAEAGANLLIAGSSIFGHDRSHKDGSSSLTKNINSLMNNLMKYGR
jgi:ribulose-phosphate 3-epimerase